MTVGRPIVLILLPLAASFVVLSLRGRGYGRARLLLLGSLRMLFALAVVLAVAKPSIVLPSPTRHIVFLIDDSPSCADRVTAARKLVEDRMSRLDATDTGSIVHFDGRAFPDRTSPVRERPPRRHEEATNIAAALEAAAAAVPPDHPGAVFLLSDGIQTDGDAEQAALRLAARGIPVYVPRPSAVSPIDARVAALDAPSVVSLGQPFRLTCRIETTRPMQVKVELTRDGQPFQTRMLDVKPGVPTVVPVVEALDAEGLHVYQARIAPPDDRFGQNNRLSVPVFVRARPLVVYLRAYAGETPVEKLLEAFEPFRFRRLASGEDLTPELLAETSVVVLDNFPAQKLGTGDRLLASFVRDAGGGLLMVGGPGSFGAGGYIDTAMDTVLPVHSDPRDADKDPLALAVVLDSSGSMGEGGGEKMEMARAAAVRTLARLAPKDLACVIAFRVTPEVVVPLGPVADGGAVARRLARISPMGGTNIFPALERALTEIQDAKQPLRHVVILSDGKSQPGDLGAVISRYRAARATLSAVATGKDADRGLLAALAAGTGGRFYEATDIRRLPELFLDDLRRLEGPLVRRGNLRLQTGESSEILKGVDLSGLPSVRACNRTRAREGAVVLLEHTVEETPEPVLAVRRMGLGRSAALMCSFERDWSGDLPTWNPWGKLVVRVLQYVHRREVSPDYALQVRREGGTFHVVVGSGARLPAETTRDLNVRLTAPSGESADVPLERTGARTWGGLAETALRGVVTGTLIEGAGENRTPVLTRYVPTSYPREFRSLRPRLDLLQRIAQMTGGRLVENLEEFRAAGGSAPRTQRDLTPWLVALVLVLFVTELVGRTAGLF